MQNSDTLSPVVTTKIEIFFLVKINIVPNNTIISYKIFIIDNNDIYNPICDYLQFCFCHKGSSTNHFILFVKFPSYFNIYSPIDFFSYFSVLCILSILFCLLFI